MAKMYYNEIEAAEKLHISRAELSRMVGEGKLRDFPDGPRKMFKVEDIDKLAPTPADSGEVMLTPADTADAVKLSDADKPAAPTKEDTVITSEGISIFDDEDLEVESADPMAKTAISASVQDQVAIEGVGSGSGLLDLTRESDDTSLGEVLEKIEVGSGLSNEQAEREVSPALSATVEGPMVMEAPAVVEQIDATSGLFAGVAVGTAVIVLVLGVVMVSTLFPSVPPFVQALADNMGMYLVAMIVLTIAFGVGGYLMGKSAADRAAALQRTM
jgi:hypothetical protein